MTKMNQEEIKIILTCNNFISKQAWPIVIGSILFMTNTPMFKTSRDTKKTSERGTRVGVSQWVSLIRDMAARTPKQRVSCSAFV